MRRCKRVADEYNALEGRAAKTGKEIGRYEREARIPVPYTRKHLAQVFGVDVAVLDRAVAVSKSRQRGDGATGSSPARSAVPPRSGVGAVSADAVMSADFARFIALRNANVSSTRPVLAASPSPTALKAWEVPPSHPPELPT